MKTVADGAGVDIPRTDNPFKEFARRQNVMIELKKAVVSLKEGLECMNLHYRVVNDCNARSAKSFPFATCETKVIAQPIAAGSVFADGIYILENFLDQEIRALPSDQSQRRALGLLVKFLTSGVYFLEIECSSSFILAHPSDARVLSKYTVHVSSET